MVCRYSGCDDLGPLPAGVQGHQHRLGRGAGAVVERAVGHLHAGQSRDERLVLEHRLQVALARLGLVGGVRGVELAPRTDDVAHRGDEVVVAPAAEEADRGAGVLIAGGQLAQVLVELQLAHRGGELKVAPQLQLVGDRREQVVDRVGSDRGEHLALILGGVVKVRHGDLRSLIVVVRLSGGA